MNLTQTNGGKQSPSYFDTYLNLCQFPEFRGTPDFAKFCIKNFVPEARQKSAEIKAKHGFTGESLTLEKWFDIIIAEGIIPLTDEEAAPNAEGLKGFCAMTEGGQPVIWVSGELELDDALPVAAHELSHYFFGDHESLFARCPRVEKGESLLERLLDFPGELKSEVLADLLAAFLLTSEAQSNG